MFSGGDVEGLYEEMLEEARKAVSLDKLGRLKEAVEHYMRAVQLLLELSKRTSEPALRKVYAEKADLYLKRCEEIRKGISKRAVEEAVAVEEAIKELPPELQGVVIVEKPEVKWEDIGGLEGAKRALMEAIVWPMLKPELFKGPREPWKGILLFGPPGCGKTLLAKAVASQCNAVFFNVSAAAIMSKWLGESEKNVSLLFEVARKSSPSVIFVDEVDSLLTVRGLEEVGGERRVKTQFLVELDGLRTRPGEKLVIGATNRPWDLDPAVIRRFEKRVYVPLPDLKARREIFRIHLRGVELAEDVDLNELAELTVGYSGSDIRLVCREAAMEPVREVMSEGPPEGEVEIRPVCREDFVKALRKVKPMTKPSDVMRYLRWAEEYGEI
ncbi:AAA family ATPase [Candidatus Bathyarchaeota archaeon ex4484_135]|nr:MAG: AAA family ATPase [Candidatus Bathyarchaeota archaeon ex4484_135]